MLGSLLKGQRHEWVLATKLGNKMSRYKVNESHYSRSWMLRELDNNLQRLQTDHVDILYMHRDVIGMDLEEPLRAIDAMLRAGKIATGACPTFAAGVLPKSCASQASWACPAPRCASLITTC